MQYIIPNWPAPPRIRAVVTTRYGGVSLSPYHTFNLAEHVGDNPIAVTKNRAILKATLQLPAEPLWLQQIHGCGVAIVGQDQCECTADAAVANSAGQVCVVLTADCLPLLLCDQEGSTVAAIHAGWRGLAKGIIETTVRKLKVRPQQLLAWLGPAIGPTAFEVGHDVRDTFIAADSEAATAFQPSPRSPYAWLANIYTLARLRLHQQGVTHISGGEFCTVTDTERFFSYRRDGGITGRIATLIWIA